MGDGPRYDVPHRRRREERTDYRQRLAALKSDRPRAIIRLSNNGAQIQFVQYRRDGDETIAAAVTSHLQEFGWDHHTGNIPAAYLTGLLAGKRAQEQGVAAAITDFGLVQPEYGSRYYAAVQGLAAAGIDIDVDDAVTPGPDRLAGEHMELQETMETVQTSIEEAYSNGG